MDTSQPPLILIVDDQKTTRVLLRRVMESEGYRVVEAKNGEDAIALYHTTSPDIILLDAVMPVMDGFTCCQQIHASFCCHELPASPTTDTYQQDWEVAQDQLDTLFNSLARPPILMITALNDTQSVDKAFTVGATDYVTKPINIPVLQHRVKRLVERSRLYQQLKVAKYELHRLATLDGLTQLANRRRFDEYLGREWRRMAREQQPLSLILCDIDYFKAYNDTYGHLAGDDCLKTVASVISQVAQRPADLVARYGGEEMAIILPNTPPDGALEVAQRIHSHLKAQQLQHKASPVSPWLSVSIGVTTMIPDRSYLPTLLIELADQALYQAKEKGRDQIQISSYGMTLSRLG